MCNKSEDKAVNNRCKIFPLDKIIPRKNKWKSELNYLNTLTFVFEKSVYVFDDISLGFKATEGDLQPNEVPFVKMTQGWPYFKSAKKKLEGKVLSITFSGLVRDWLKFVLK